MMPQPPSSLHIRAELKRQLMTSIDGSFLDPLPFEIDVIGGGGGCLHIACAASRQCTSTVGYYAHRLTGP
jgi:hypothetical protein